MAGESDKTSDSGKSSDVPATETKDTGGVAKKKERGVLSRIWYALFRLHGDDFEKRLQYISKEEATVLARMKRRSQSWRRMARNMIICSVILEVIAVGYAIMTTRSVELNWKMRAARVLPMFLLPALSFLTYSTLVSLTKMFDRKDQKTLEKLRAERQAKIDELKEKTNYYTTQQLIQRYDPDPAAKAAAATVLASKLGADSGLKVYLQDENEHNAPTGKSNDVELVQSAGLRNRRPVHKKSQSATGGMLQLPEEELLADTEPSKPHDQLVVAHHNSGSTSHDGGWIARIAALLVGEDPTQSYALICGNCHMHNGLARKEEFPFIQYYCPHCNALNKSNLTEGLPLSASPNLSSSTASNTSTVLTSDRIPTSTSSPQAAAASSAGIGEGSEIVGESEPVSS